MDVTLNAEETATRYWDEERLSEDRARVRARIGGLHCSLCTGTIEKALGRRPGVSKVAVSLTHEQALIEYDARVESAENLMGTLRDIGYTIWDPRKVRSFDEEERDLVRERNRLLAATAISAVTIGLMLGALWIGLGGWLPWLLGAFALVVVFGLAWHILEMAAQSLRRGILNQHVMLEVGAFSGLAGGIIGLVAHPAGYPTGGFFAVSVLVVNYHIFSEWLSLVVRTRSSQAVKRLIDLQPDTARVVRDGQERDLPLVEVRLGDRVRVRPGKRVPVDGRVVDGHSAVDESLVTGEALPAAKSEGDSVIGGSINGTGTLLVEVTAIGEESFLQRVIRHVEDARALKPGILHLVDRVLTVYAPAVLSLAGLSFLFWTAGAELLFGDADLQRAVFAALSVMVMGYPCAVGIAAPLAIVRGAGIAAEQGIIMRTGEAFQAFRQVTTIVLDKTGTLTEGRFTVRDVFGTADENAVLQLAATAEASSEHPLGQAIVKVALERGLRISDAPVFEAVPGRGIRAEVDGEQVLVGNAAFLESSGIDVDPLRTSIQRAQERGHTVAVVSKGERLAGGVALGDDIRPDAELAIRRIMERGIRPILVTGDNRQAAERVAKALGIDEVHAGMLPDEKGAVVRDLQRHGRVAMVGDGINDAPALMQADVGIAMGAGTDIAIESSDIIVVGNRLDSILVAQEISRRSYAKTRQNVVLAFLFNGVGVTAATTGLVYPVWAMLAMALSVTTVFANSLWGRLSLLTSAVRSVGRPPAEPEDQMDRAA